ncbi:Imm3 family immunity protein [Paenibacillus sp. ACRSA]|uniref:Imm3 family immunity protein n=1 Tax=Paenibacillus sp. ACRSA TaxID=2918211 RepID=UPI001EF474E9|nr:Imm3 family immunity protein [Paenibacillus sp. ACRSA]MCG7376400.1 Imm3 family immunity protein [Paenibacillus sp. ACRSA]
MAWQYQDLIDEFNGDVERYKNEYYSHDEAINMTFNEFYSESIVDEMEKALIFIVYVELSLQNPRIYGETKEILVHALESINFEKIERQIEGEQLTHEQFEELLNRKYKVLQKVKLMPLDLSNQARWYYTEITNSVRDSCLELVANNINGEEIIKQVLCRYKRSCDRTVSTKITVYVTLAEFLVRNDQPFPEKLLNEIHSFNINTVCDELVLEEKTDLVQRINSLIEQ